MAEASLIADLTSNNIGELSRARLSVVDFWAPWCVPCKKFHPIFEEVCLESYKKYGMSVRFFRVNVDQEAVLAQRFGVSNLPTVMGFFGGVPVDRFSGRYKHELASWIELLIQRYPLVCQ